MPTAVSARFGAMSDTGLAKEAAFGTGLTPSTFFPMTGNSLNLDPGLFSPKLMYGHRDANSFALYGQYKNAGTIAGPIWPTNAATLIPGAIGPDAQAGYGVVGSAGSGSTTLSGGVSAGASSITVASASGFTTGQVIQLDVNNTSTPTTAECRKITVSGTTFTLDQPLTYAHLTGVAVVGVVSPYCVDEQTEILTEDGWKTVHDLQVGDVVLTYNHTTGMSEWQPALEVCVFPAASRELIRMQGRGHSSLSTPNHRWPVINENGTRLWKTTETLSQGNRIPIGATCADLPIESKYTDAFVETVAWFWTEGTIRGVSSVVICQSQKNADNVERIDAALRTLLGAPATSKMAVGDPVPRWRRITDGPNVRFRLNATAGALLTHVAPNRVVRHDFIRSLTQAQLDLFIKVSMLADNCGPTRLSQKERGRSEAFQFAAILAGYGSSILERVFKRDGYRMWGVTLKKTRSIVPLSAAKQGDSYTVQREMHDGLVWCPRTPNMTWYARRDGQCYFTGNTHSIQQAVALSSYTVEKCLGGPVALGGESLQFAGARVNKLSINVTATDAEAALSADMVAQSAAVLATPTAVTVVSEMPYVFSEGTLSLFGQTLAIAEGFTMDIDNKLISSYTFNQSHNLEFLTPGMLEVSGKVDLIWQSFDDATWGYFTQMLNAGNGVLTFTLAHPAGGGSVAFSCPKVYIKTVTEDPKPEDVVKSTLNYTAFLNAATNNTVTATIIDLSYLAL